MLTASTTGELGTVELLHGLLSLGKQPGCLATGDNAVKVKGVEREAEES